MKRVGSIAAGAAGILILPAAYWVRTWDSFAAVRDFCPRLFCDFSNYYYPMGETVFRTGLPVDGFLYSPFVAILLALFPPLGLDASLLLWGILQVLLVSLYFLLFRRVLSAPLEIQLLFVGVCFLSYPVLFNLMAGQVSVFIMVPLLGMLIAYERGQRAGAAGLLALAVSFKFYPIIFLALFLARRDARAFFLGVTACGTALLVIPGLLLGPGDTLAFYGGLLDQFSDSGWVVVNPHSQFFPHVALRLSGGLLPHLPLILISYAVAAANLGLLFLIQRARLRHADLWGFQLLFLTVPFFLKTSWPHDFVFLPFTQAFLVWQLLEKKAAPGETDEGKRSISGAQGDADEGKRSISGAQGDQVAGRSGVVMWALLIVSIALSNIVFFDLFGFVRYGSFGFLFWANLLLLIVSYVLLLPPTLQRLRRATARARRVA